MYVYEIFKNILGTYMCLLHIKFTNFFSSKLIVNKKNKKLHFAIFTSFKESYWIIVI